MGLDVSTRAGGSCGAAGVAGGTLSGGGWVAVGGAADTGGGGVSRTLAVCRVPDPALVRAGARPGFGASQGEGLAGVSCATSVFATGSGGFAAGSDWAGAAGVAAGAIACAPAGTACDTSTGGSADRCCATIMTSAPPPAPAARRSAMCSGFMLLLDPFPAVIGRRMSRNGFETR